MLVTLAVRMTFCAAVLKLAEAAEALVVVVAEVGAVTVSVSFGLVTLPCVAVMLVVPVATAVASPEALMVATLVVEEDQVTELVMLAVEPSEKVPVAVNC